MENFKIKAGIDIKNKVKKNLGVILQELLLQELWSGRVTNACGLGGLFKLHSKEL